MTTTAAPIIIIATAATDQPSEDILPQASTTPLPKANRDSLILGNTDATALSAQCQRRSSPNPAWLQGPLSSSSGSSCWTRRGIHTPGVGARAVTIPPCPPV